MPVAAATRDGRTMLAVLFDAGHVSHRRRCSIAASPRRWPPRTTSTTCRRWSPVRPAMLPSRYRVPSPPSSGCGGRAGEQPGLDDPASPSPWCSAPLRPSRSVVARAPPRRGAVRWRPRSSRCLTRRSAASEDLHIDVADQAAVHGVPDELLEALREAAHQLGRHAELLVLLLADGPCSSSWR